MKKRLAFSLVLPLIIASVVVAQQPLKVDVSIVQVEAVKQTIERTTLKFESVELAPTESVESSKSSSIPAALITVSEAATVDAFSTDFDIAEVTPAGENRFLLTGKPGKYMAVVDTGDRNKYVPIVIPGKATDPGEPEEPETPDLDLSSLADSSNTLASKVNDLPTRQALAVSLGGDIEGSFSEMRVEIQTRVEDTLLVRKGESRKKDWLNGWRRPISEEMVRLKVETAEQYREAIRQIVVGLKRDSQGSQSVLKLKKSPTLAKSLPVQSRPRLTNLLPQSRTRLIPVTRLVCGPLGVCREVTEWIEVTE